MNPTQQDLPAHTVGKYSRTKADTGGYGGAGTFWFVEWQNAAGATLTTDEHTTRRAAVAEFRAEFA